MFGEGSIRFEWYELTGKPGLRPTLGIKGKGVARGYGIGAVIQVSSEVTAWDIEGTYAYLGSTIPLPMVLNYIKQPYVEMNPQPHDETGLQIESLLHLDLGMIEALEERRQGKDFSLQLDTTLLLIDRRTP